MFLKEHLLACVLLCICYSLTAQICSEGLPPSQSEIFSTKLKNKPTTTISLAPIDRAIVLQEDAVSEGNRIAAPIATNLTLTNSGEWVEFDNGDRIWRLKIQAKDALGLSALFDQFYLPPGGQLFVYNLDYSKIKGGYTANNNKASQRFMVGPIQGDQITVEYYEPASVKGEGRFRIFRVDYAYKPFFKPPLAPEKNGFGDAAACNINVNCPLGEGWEEEKRGVCRIFMTVEEGTVLCSGSLINNTDLDGKPYVLTAFHCTDTYTPLFDLWRFDFNYEGQGCDNPVEEPNYDSVLGCVYRSGWQDTDFQLVEISSFLPNSYDLFWNGWQRGLLWPDSCTNIHHPMGDIKKISRDYDLAFVHPSDLEWNNGVTTPADHHYRLTYEEGTFEVGSSGSPLFDTDGLIVGQLHGGFPNCQTFTVAYFGRLALSWEGGGTATTRLKDWLDPQGSLVAELSGMSYELAGAGTISGRITTPANDPIAGVTVKLSGGVQAEYITEADGVYSFEDLPLGMSYTVEPEKDNNHGNGLSTLDLILMRQHILGMSELDQIYKFYAADVNESYSISTLDLIFIRRLILGIDDQFEDSVSWKFFNGPLALTEPGDNFPPTFPTTSVTINNLAETLSEIHFTGFKVGDINGSANPGN